jgi:hypothetical protein
MTFEAYIDDIQAKTGQSPDDFRRMAEEKGMAGSRRCPSEHCEPTDWSQFRASGGEMTRRGYTKLHGAAPMAVFAA